MKAVPLGQRTEVNMELGISKPSLPVTSFQYTAHKKKGLHQEHKELSNIMGLKNRRDKYIGSVKIYRECTIES